VGNRILRRHGSAPGYSSGFTIMDREDQKNLINAAAVRLQLKRWEKKL
jgi:superfamily I DNA/RNA helicase